GRLPGRRGPSRPQRTCARAGGKTLTDLTDAVRALREGLVVVIPTDTVYGVAVDPFIPGATRRLFEAKRRPTDVRLPRLVDDLTKAAAVADVDERARMLMDHFWPGGLTIILPMRSGVDLALGNG